jgi:hypothetical protein
VTTQAGTLANRKQNPVAISTSNSYCGIYRSIVGGGMHLEDVI